MGSKFGKSRSADDAFQRSISTQIEKRMQEEDMEQRTTLNILLLGAGGSGKTTVFKQMQKVFAGFIEQKEMELAVHIIRENIVDDMINLCKFNVALNKMQLNETDRDKYIVKQQRMKELCTKFANMNNIMVHLTEQLATEICTLWTGSVAIQNTWNIRKKSHTMDNTPYFFQKSNEIAKDNYIVTFDDFVRVRDPTTGIMDKKYLVESEFGKYKFNVTDVGGQRSERRKWLQLFDQMNVVVYIMNLSGYDQVLYEDNSRNCLIETLELFSLTSHSKAFDNTDWVVFFNKIDLFKEKIKSVPFTVYKEDFDDDDKNNADKVQEYIKKEFDERFRLNTSLRETLHNKKLNRSIFFHTICAIDEDEIGECIKTVQIDIIASLMKKMGYC